jgi:APA family basic amino acid/polyamine antiporter
MASTATVGKREGIGLISSLSLVMATMVGTGVYTALGFQLQDLHSGFSILCLWVLGGMISLCGALSYAELAARIPRSGGEYTYLSEIYHPALGFMAAFVSLIAGFAVPIALSTMAFGSYLHAAFPACPAHLSSVSAVLLISMVHLRSLRMSSLLQVVATGLKFLLLALFIATGLGRLFHHPGELSILKPTAESSRELLHPSSGIALIFVLYAYSGWNAATYLAGEVREGRRTVGRSLVMGTIAVTFFYVALNAVFLTCAPVSEMRGVLNVGSIAAAHLIGPAGGRVMSGIIAFGLLASISAMIWAGPRVTQRVGEDYPALRFLGRKSRAGIPTRALLLQLLLVLGLIACGSFETVLVFAQIPLLLCLVLGVAGLLIERTNEKGKTTKPAQGGFRCPLYPVTPMVFIACSAASVIYSTISKPVVALAGGLIMLLPLILHRWIISPPKP